MGIDPLSALLFGFKTGAWFRVDDVLTVVSALGYFAMQPQVRRPRRLLRVFNIKDYAPFQY